MATSLAVPVAYITVLVTALAIFSRVYRRRKLAAESTYEPWFPSHPSRDFYISLLSSPEPLDNMVKSALLLRAIEDVKRIWRIRDDKTALASLHQRGLLGDDTKSRFEFAEKELEAEILDVVQEANSFKQGWGSLIFATATEMAQAERTRETVLSIPKIRQREEKRLAVRRKYLPESTPPAVPASVLAAQAQAQAQSQGQGQIQITPAMLQAAAQAQAQAQAQTSQKSTITPASAAASEASTPALKGLTPAQIAALGDKASITPGGTPTASTSGTSSGASTPSKSTPSKKKKGKK